MNKDLVKLGVMAAVIILGGIFLRFDLDRCGGEATLGHLIAEVVIMVQFVLYSVSCLKFIRDRIKEKRAEKLISGFTRSSK